MNEFKSPIEDELIAAAEREAERKLLARVDRVHLDALLLITDECEKLLDAIDENPEPNGTLSMHALSLLSTFATVRNAANQSAIANANAHRTEQIGDIEALAEGYLRARMKEVK